MLQGILSARTGLVFWHIQQFMKMVKGAISAFQTEQILNRENKTKNTNSNVYNFLYMYSLFFI